MSDRVPPSASEAPRPLYRGWVRRLNALLARRPGLYLWVLRRWRPADRERFAYVALVRRGDVVFDVGANVGLFAILFSDLVGPAGRVHAFEPVAATFARLADSVARHARFDNVRINQCACTNEAGTSRIHVPAGDGGQASLKEHRTGSWSHPGVVRCESVDATTLDRYIRQHGLDRVDLIKCDVEGAELRVLEGADACLTGHHPMLSLEVSTDWTSDFGYDPPALLRFLRARGYDWFALVSADAVRALDPGDGGSSLAFPAGTMLFCGATDRHGDRLSAYLADAATASTSGSPSGNLQ
jgi:FkbM family methyltransferase